MRTQQHFAIGIPHHIGEIFVVLAQRRYPLIRVIAVATKNFENSQW